MERFNPQSLEQMQARYREALTPLYDYVTERVLAITEETVPGGKAGPGPSHIFDYHNGMRLIVTRDREETGVYLHMSAGIIPGTEFWNTLVGRGEAGKQLLRMSAETRYIDLSGDSEPLPFNGFSSRGIGHWRRLEEAGLPR